MKTFTFIRIVTSVMLILLVVWMCINSAGNIKQNRFDLSKEKDSIIKELGYKLDSTIKIKNKVVTRWRKITDTLTIENSDTFTITIVKTCDTIINFQDSMISILSLQVSNYDTLTGMLKNELKTKNDTIFLLKSDLNSEKKTKKRWRIVAIGSMVLNGILILK